MGMDNIACVVGGSCGASGSIPVPLMGLNARGDPGSCSACGHFPISLQLASCLSPLSYLIKSIKAQK